MDKLFVALDFKQEAEMWSFMDYFKSQPIAVKVGMSQFYLSGPDLVKRLADDGHCVFLDLKSHDIPNTVYLAMTQLSKLPVDIVTIHTLGGQEMMEAAMDGIQTGPYQPKVLGITQLTSTNQAMLHSLGIELPMEASVRSLAQLAQASGLDGVVSSVHEVTDIKKATSSDFLCLTPGIRMAGSQADDQSRTASPSQARQAGADYIVVGRPITQAEDPIEAYNRYLQDWRN